MCMRASKDKGDNLRVHKGVIVPRASKCMSRLKFRHMGAQVYVRASKDEGDSLIVHKGGHSPMYLEMHTITKAIP